MCGIVGAVAQRDVVDILVEGLRRLEYRGYDSAGVAVVSASGELQRIRRLGKVKELADAVKLTPTPGGTGIAHTRWATHGEPSERNAHPHVSDKISVVHNGIIENYVAIKEELMHKGYQFLSDTDTEVLLNFIEDIRINNDCPLEEALRIALKRIVGAYCILLIDLS